MPALATASSAAAATGHATATGHAIATGNATEASAAARGLASLAQQPLSDTVATAESHKPAIATEPFTVAALQAAPQGVVQARCANAAAAATGHANFASAAASAEGGEGSDAPAAQPPAAKRARTVYRVEPATALSIGGATASSAPLAPPAILTSTEQHHTVTYVPPALRRTPRLFSPTEKWSPLAPKKPEIRVGPEYQANKPPEPQHDGAQPEDRAVLLRAGDVTLEFEEPGGPLAPWGPLAPPAAPPGAGAKHLSGVDLNLHMKKSVLRTGREFVSQSFEFAEVDKLAAARILIGLNLRDSLAGAVKYVVYNIKSTKDALLGLLEHVLWNGKHIGKLANSQQDGNRRFISFDALLLYFEDQKDLQKRALCQVVVMRFKMVVTFLLIGFGLPPVHHKLGVMLTAWGADDQTWHDDTLGVTDTYSGLLALMDRGIDLLREGGGCHTMRMAADGDNAEGCIFESPLIHRGKGAPIPSSPKCGRRWASKLDDASKLDGFSMWSDGSSEAKRVTIQSAALHYYGGTNACKIPLADKHAQLSHHE